MKRKWEEPTNDSEKKADGQQNTRERKVKVALHVGYLGKGFFFLFT